MNEENDGKKVDTVDNHETGVPRVRVWRAITGRRNPDGSFNGVSDSALRNQGIFTPNFSETEYPRSVSADSNLESYMDDMHERGLGDLADIAAMHPGKPNPNILPVFTTFEEAVNWLSGKKFHGDPPAIIQLSLPVGMLSGEKAPFHLFENHASGNPDVELYPDDLLRLSYEQTTQAQTRRGEHYLMATSDNTRIPESVRSHETIYRPEGWEPGEYTDQPLVKVDLT